MPLSSTWPSPGSDSGPSTIAKSSVTGMPLGRRLSKTCRFISGIAFSCSWCRPWIDHGKTAARKATSIARGNAGASRQYGRGDQRIEFLDRLPGLATGHDDLRITGRRSRLEGQEPPGEILGEH